MMQSKKVGIGLSVKSEISTGNLLEMHQMPWPLQMYSPFELHTTVKLNRSVIALKCSSGAMHDCVVQAKKNVLPFAFKCTGIVHRDRLSF